MRHKVLLCCGKSLMYVLVALPALLFLFLSLSLSVCVCTASCIAVLAGRGGKGRAVAIHSGNNTGQVLRNSGACCVRVRVGSVAYPGLARAQRRLKQKRCEKTG